jgi:hypothetical protein
MLKVIGGPPMSLFETGVLQNNRKNDPLEDRRSGEDRRVAYDLDYFMDGGKERRSSQERRKGAERRENCQRVSQWSSVCPSEE